MIHCSAVADIEGAHIMTDRGERLTVIGNIYPQIGHMVWTDGVVCYGDRPVVGGPQPSVMRKYIGYLFSNGSAINYLDNYFEERQYLEKCENSYLVTGENHVWVLNAGGGKISGVNATDLLNAKAEDQREIEISVPNQSEVRDACVDDQGDLHMIVLVVDNGEETIRIYRNDSLVVAKKNVDTIEWPDKKKTQASKIAWYAHIEKDGSYNVLTAYKYPEQHEAVLGRDIPWTGIIRNEKDWQQYTGKVWLNKIVQCFDFNGFWYNRRIVDELGLTRQQIEGTKYALNLRQIDEMLKTGAMQPDEIYGDWYTGEGRGGKGALYSIGIDDIDMSTTGHTENGNVPMFPTLKETILDYRNYHQYKMFLNDEEIASFKAHQDFKKFYPTVAPDEIKFCGAADANADRRVIVNPQGNFWSVAMTLDPEIWGEQYPWDHFFENDSMGIKSFTVAYYIDEFPGDYKRERQHMYVAAYRTERPSTAPIYSDPKFDIKSKPSIVIPCTDGEIKLSEIKPVNPIVKIDDLKALHGYLKTVPDDGVSDSKRMIGQCFTANGQIASYSFCAEDTWIADIHNAGDGKGGEIPMLLTDKGLTIIGAKKKASSTYNSRHNTRINYYDPITDYLAKG